MPLTVCVVYVCVFVFMLQAVLKHIRGSVFGRGRCQSLSMEVGGSPAPRLLIPQQSCWGPSLREETSVCFLPGSRTTSKVQRGHLLCSGQSEVLFKFFIITYSPCTSRTTSSKTQAVQKASLSLFQ